MSLRHELFFMAQSWRKTSLRRHDERPKKNHGAIGLRLGFFLTARSWRTAQKKRNGNLTRRARHQRQGSKRLRRNVKTRNA
jgi:hypothetical protein